MKIGNLVKYKKSEEIIGVLRWTDEESKHLESMGPGFVIAEREDPRFQAPVKVFWPTVGKTEWHFFEELEFLNG